MQEPTELSLLTATQITALLKINTITVEDYARSLICRIDERRQHSRGMGIPRYHSALPAAVLTNEELH